LTSAIVGFADELRSVDLHDHHRRRAPLQHITALQADLLEGIPPLALHFRRKNLDRDVGEILR